MPPVTADRSPPNSRMTGADFTCDRGFVDRGHALDHFAVRGDRIAGFDENDVADLEAGTGYELVILMARSAQQLRLGPGALPAQRVGLRLATAFRDRLREVGEQHGKPQPQDDLELEADVLSGGDKVANQDDGCQRRDDLEHEHDWFLNQRPRVELDKSRADGWQHDLGIEQRRHRDALAQD